MSNVARFIRQGNMRAYTFLFNELYAPLISYSSGITGDRQAAEDIVQNLFCRIWEKRVMLSENRSLKTYMYISVRNRSINHLRGGRVFSINPKDNVCSDNNISLEILEEEIYSDLHLAINHLPQRCREIFILKLKGNSNREIAGQLGINEDTVRSQFRHGKEMVRFILSQL